MANDKGFAAMILKGHPEYDKATEDGGDEGDVGLEACAEELIHAVHAKDVQGVVEALRSAFTQLESAPHEEAGPEETQES